MRQLGAIDKDLSSLGPETDCKLMPRRAAFEALDRQEGSSRRLDGER
jgi:hypothetical protein